MLSGWDEGLGLGVDESEGIPWGVWAVYLYINIYPYEAIIKHPYTMVLY